MKLFNTIAIETSALCNRHCVFCPNHENTRPDEEMPEEVFMKILEDLKQINYKGRISLYIYNEPLRDKRMLRFIQLTRQHLPRACIMLSTNGDYIKSKQIIDDLFAAGMNQFVINVYSEKDGDPNPDIRARGVKNAEARYEVLKSYLHGYPWGKGVYQYMSPKRKLVYMEKKYGTWDSRFELQNRSGNISWFKESVKEPISAMCVRPFRMLNINWRGRAILCCNDYHGITETPSVMEKSVLELWEDPMFYTYRKALQDKNRNLPLCDKCDYKGGSYKHLIQRVE